MYSQILKRLSLIDIQNQVKVYNIKNLILLFQIDSIIIIIADVRVQFLYILFKLGY
jgi:hypothetical protein